MLASHGNNELGRDDFDRRLVERLAQEFEREHGVPLGPGAARARLRVAAIKKATGKSKEIVIQHALEPRTQEEIAAARERTRRLFEGHRSEGAFDLAAAPARGSAWRRCTRTTARRRSS